MQLGGGFESDGVVGALLPTELRVERMVLGLNGVAEGEEKLAQIVGGAAHHRKGDLQIEGLLDEFGTVFAPGPQGVAEDAVHGHGEEAGSGVRTVVDVLFQPLAGTPHQADGVDFQEHAEAAALGADFGVEDVDLAVGHRIGLDLVRVFVDQVAEIGRSESPGWPGKKGS